MNTKTKTTVKKVALQRFIKSQKVFCSSQRKKTRKLQIFLELKVTFATLYTYHTVKKYFFFVKI